MKKFLVKDQSGRGINVVLSLEQFKKNGWDLGYCNNPDDQDDPTLGEWLEGAELGDEYLHEEERFEIICTDEGEDE